MSDITKVRETYSKDGGDWDEWPYPTVEIESVIEGGLRARVLAVLEMRDDGQPVTLIESKVSSGYSEFTQEDECSIEVKVGQEIAWKDEWNYDSASAMARFLAKFAAPFQRAAGIASPER